MTFLKQRLGLKKTLEERAEQFRGESLRTLFKKDPQRAQHLSFDWQDWQLDLSKQRLDRSVIERLSQLARHECYQTRLQNMLQGDLVNGSEGRAAMHMALRAPLENNYCPAEYVQKAHAVHQNMFEFARQVRDGHYLGLNHKPLRHIVNIGIGGSDLGPRFLVSALPEWCSGPKAYFVSNLDPVHLDSIISELPLDQTLFVLASKSFDTQETLCNAYLARQAIFQKYGLTDKDQAAWSKHFVAITANIKAAEAFGVLPQNCFPLWDWVGGRFSIWSAIALTAVIALGEEVFQEFLQGGSEMDQHFLSANPENNFPLLLAYVDIWNINFLNYHSRLVLPYSQRLGLLPTYLQQLEMESNGKSVDIQGELIQHKTAPFVWGQAGTRGQHTFHQLLHQGTVEAFTEFIVVIEAKDKHHQEQHYQMGLNALAQSAVLAFGQTQAEALQYMSKGCLNADKSVQELSQHCIYTGNQPSSFLVIDRITPRVLGRLIAMYEHKVFSQAAFWEINPFDQWGVELGKRIAKGLAKNDLSSIWSGDASTPRLLNRLRKL